MSYTVFVAAGEASSGRGEEDGQDRIVDCLRAKLGRFDGKVSGAVEMWVGLASGI
jgi:hypothetical protein